MCTYQDARNGVMLALKKIFVLELVCLVQKEKTCNDRDTRNYENERNGKKNRICFYLIILEFIPDAANGLKVLGFFRVFFDFVSDSVDDNGDGAVFFVVAM